MEGSSALISIQRSRADGDDELLRALQLRADRHGAFILLKRRLPVAVAVNQQLLIVSAAPPPTSHTFSLLLSRLPPSLTPLPPSPSVLKQIKSTHTHTDDMFINHLFSRATVPDLPLISELSAAEDSRLTFTGRSTLQ